MSTLLGNKNVEESIFLNMGGVPVEHIIVHKGKPSSIYDDSCDGVWVVPKDGYESRQMHSSNVNDYANSTVHSYLNSTYLALFDADIQAAIQTVKIPYRAGSGTSSTITSGSSGLSCKVFLLSGYEVGFTTSNNSYFPQDGARLDYFLDGDGTDARAKRIAYLNGSATLWWTRSPYIGNSTSFWRVDTSGTVNANDASNSFGLRPALVLPSSLSVASDGSIATNTAPTISGTDTDLGQKTTTFAESYAVYDADGDTTTVVEKINGTQQRSFVATLGATNNFEVDASTFRGLGLGSHTLTVEATDSHGEVALRNLTFTKIEGKLVLTMTTPLECDDRVTMGSLSLTKSVAPGSSFMVEVCNNGNDAEPTWEDVTQSVESGFNFTLDNEQKTASAWGYNVRITASRNDAEGDCWLSYMGGFFK